jgi:hypothetical protein
VCQSDHLPRIWSALAQVISTMSIAPRLAKLGKITSRCRPSRHWARRRVDGSSGCSPVGRIGGSYFCIEVSQVGPKQACNEVPKNLIDIKLEIVRIARGDINEAYV